MKTIVRILFNNLVKKHAPTFIYPLLDIGGGASPSYSNLMKNEQRYVLDCNLNFKGNKNTLIIDLDSANKVNLKQKFKTVIAYNFFEHVFNHKNILRNIYALMTKNAELHVFIPFLIPYHPDPNDYVRFTAQGLVTLLEENKFKVQKIDCLGGYFTLLLQYLQYFPVIGLFFVFLLPLVTVLDKVIAKKIGDKYYQRYVLGYYVVARLKR